jgi:hypothetical protein
MRLTLPIGSGHDAPPPAIVAVYLAQFGTDADARSYGLAAQSADLADRRNELRTAVTGVSDGILIEAPAPDKFGNTVTKLIGDVAIIVHIFLPAHLPLPGPSAAADGRDADAAPPGRATITCNCNGAPVTGARYREHMRL